MKQTPHRALVIDLEYDRAEVNEPISVDTILDSLSPQVSSFFSFEIWYRSLGDLEPRRLSDYNPILISTKVTSLPALNGLLSQISPDKTVIVGGMLATFAPEALLRDYDNLILSRGECEANLDGILSLFLTEQSPFALKKRIEKAGVSGVSFVREDGSLYSSPIVPCDLSRIEKPLSHRALDETMRRGGLVRLEGSRGCPWNSCAFCCVDTRYGNGLWRPFPISRTLAEMELLAKKGVSTFYFTDEDFIACREHFVALFGAVAEKKRQGLLPAQLRVWGSTSVRTLRSLREWDEKRFVSLARECGIELLFIGVESGCDAQLCRYQKGSTAKEEIEILHWLSSVGISVDAGFILFDAKTSFPEIRENLAFFSESGLEKTTSRLAKAVRVIPKTRLWHEYQKDGLLIGTTDWNELNHPYRFRDDAVAMLYEALCRFERERLDRANAMQAEWRMQGGEETEAALVDHRMEEYEFLRAFLDRFETKPCTREDVARFVSDWERTHP